LPPDILIRGAGERGAQCERGIGLQRLRRWQRIQRLARKHVLRADVLDVDDRAGAGDGDGFLDRSHAHLGIDGRGEPGRQGNAFPFHRVESRKTERDRVRARPQLDDLVLSLVVGRHASNLFDQRGTGGFYCHAWDHGARRVLHHTGKGAGSAGLGPTAVRQ